VKRYDTVFDTPKQNSNHGWNSFHPWFEFCSGVSKRHQMLGWLLLTTVIKPHIMQTVPFQQSRKVLLRDVFGEATCAM